MVKSGIALSDRILQLIFQCADKMKTLTKRLPSNARLRTVLTEVKFTNRKEALLNKTNKRDFTVCYYLQSGRTESQKDSHETLARHSTAT